MTLWHPYLPAALHRLRRPRVLVITPEITYLPPGMSEALPHLCAKAGGLADVSASLVAALFEQGADVHVALPHYRQIFAAENAHTHRHEMGRYYQKLNRERIHLAEDRAFYYRDTVYSGYELESVSVALAFQREVINNIILRVRPDLIHCHDWMTGLIPAAARSMGIPCVFTVHNIHTQRVTMAEIEDRGIDAAAFWEHLYFAERPHSYHQARQGNAVDFLTSGIFSSDAINTVSPRFLWEVTQGWHSIVPASVRGELQSKAAAGYATGILNAPDPIYDPATDPFLDSGFDATSHVLGKARNKRALQARLGLHLDPDAPLCYWPSRLDPVQKGPQLLTDILAQTMDDYADRGLQIAIVADGPHHGYFHDIVARHQLRERVAVVPFDEALSHLAYAAADFMLMPSLFEPCGLPQMISPLYGTLSIVHATGGLYDTVEPLDLDHHTGNGFRFDIYSSHGLRWAVDEALRFYALPAECRAHHIERIMTESRARFHHGIVAQKYTQLYEKILQRPLTGTPSPSKPSVEKRARPTYATRL